MKPSESEHKRNPHQHHPKGSALLMVLVLLGALAMLAAIVARSVAGSALEMNAERAFSQDEADLRAGVELGVAAILKLGDNIRSAEATAQLAGRRLIVRATNERARIDLNGASSAMLSGLFVAVGVDKTEADSLAAAVEDWRGGSASQKLVAADRTFGPPTQLGSLGAQSDLDARQAPRQIVGSRYFIHPIQLAAIPGFTKELVRAVLPFVTVANGLGQIDPFIAPAPVLAALPGVSAANVEAFRQALDSNTSHDLALAMLAADKALLNEDAALGWRLEIVTVLGSGHTRKKEAIVALLRGEDDPFRILYVADDGETAGLAKE